MAAFAAGKLEKGDILEPRIAAFLLRTGRMKPAMFDGHVNSAIQAAANYWIAENVTNDATRLRMLKQSVDYTAQLKALLRNRPFFFEGGVDSAVSFFMRTQLTELASGSEGVGDAIKSAIAEMRRVDPLWAQSEKVGKSSPEDLAKIFQIVNAKLTRLTPLPSADNGLTGYNFVSGAGVADITPETIALWAKQAVLDFYGDSVKSDAVNLRALDKVLAQKLLINAAKIPNFDLLKKYADANNIDLNKLIVEANGTIEVGKGLGMAEAVQVALGALKAQIPEGERRAIDFEIADRVTRGGGGAATSASAGATAAGQKVALQAVAANKEKAINAIQGLVGAELLGRLAVALGTDIGTLLEPYLQAIYTDKTMTPERAIELALRGGVERLPFKDQW
ncbi:MAG: hypothetical protein EXR47_06320 [Dehalococcoidia bacterium]|nr:hypothetical protein [Dehalococcoidia bacterium]